MWLRLYQHGPPNIESVMAGISWLSDIMAFVFVLTLRCMSNGSATAVLQHSKVCVLLIADRWRCNA